MKRVVLSVVFLVACGGPVQPPPEPPSNHPASTELRCKTAVEHAATVVHVSPREVTMAIGECEQQEWPQLARECVNDIKSDADLVACGEHDGLGKRGIFAGHTSSEKALAKMEEFKDKLCACKDAACTQHVSDEMSKWAQDAAKDQTEPPHMTEEDTKRATAIGEEMGTCMQAAMSAPP
jgi:hypothetical protein